MTASRVLAAALLLAGACSRAPQAPAKFIDYTAPNGAFTARLPYGWRVDERPGAQRLADFFGPESGPDAEMIEVAFHPTGRPAVDANAYVYAQAATGRANAVTTSADGTPTYGVTVEKDVVDERSGPRVMRVRTLAYPRVSGFYVLQDYVNPARKPDPAIFEAFAASFQPGAAPK